MLNLSFLFIILFSVQSHAQSSLELTCKAKAKDIAIQTYSNCVTEARNSKIEKIRSSYKKELSQIKAKYDNELKSLDETGPASKPVSSKKTLEEKNNSNNSNPPKATKGIAKSLPTRSESKAIPLETIEDTKELQAIPLNEEEQVEDASEAIEGSDADMQI